jgi:hypothetical protein
MLATALLPSGGISTSGGMITPFKFTIKDGNLKELYNQLFGIRIQEIEKGFE